MVGAEIRDEMLTRESGLGGSVQEVTVLFADLRDFTRRSAGQPPERIVALLNRFFTLSVEAIEEHGGHVNKFLGDGFMALFGVLSHRQQDHVDQALRAAAALLKRLQTMNL
ncbi:MAG: adenylate/guanylate cyclase domain-containing protein, partial [Pseudomonadota bacterium]